MNLEKLIEKYLGEWLTAGSMVRIEYTNDGPNKWTICLFSTRNDVVSSSIACCEDIEKGLEVIRERLQKK